MILKCKLVNESYKLKQGENVRFGDFHISLVCARNDWVAFQILLQGDDEFTLSLGKNTNFPYTSFDTVSGKMRPIDELRLETTVAGLPEAGIEMHPIDLAADNDGIEKADILLNDETVVVSYKRVQSVWAEARIPANAPPGLYSGEVRIYRHSLFEDEQRIQVLPFQIRVKDVLMPEPKEYAFHLDLWQHLSNIARKHEVERWSEKHFKVLEAYVKSLFELGQKAITIIASEIPWSGQGCYRRKNYLSDLYEYNMAQVLRTADGTYRYDFSAMERYLDLCLRYGIDGEIEVFGLVNIWTDEAAGFGKVSGSYPDAIRLRYFDEASGCFRFVRRAEEITQYVAALEGFFREKGLIDKVRVVADEPADVALYEKRLSLLAKAAPGFRYKTAVNHAGFIGKFRDQVSDFSISLPSVSQEWEQLRHVRGRIRGRLSWYVANTPEFPNMLIRSPLLECRLVGLLTDYMGFDGFLRWNYTVWPETPRKKLATDIAGDTHFVYPANDGTPLLSLRYKNLKRGIEDFELIRMLRKSGADSGAILEQVWDRIFKEKDIRKFDPAQDKTAEELYSLDESDYEWAKEQIMDGIANS